MYGYVKHSPRGVGGAPDAPLRLKKKTTRP